MKKLLSIILSLILLVSCQSGVVITYNKPSEIDLSQHKSLAILKASKYKSMRDVGIFIKSDDPLIYIPSTYSYNINEQVASYLTSNLYDKLNYSNYFNLTSPEKTELLFYINDKLQVGSAKLLKDNNIDAILVLIVKSMNIDEYIKTNDKKESYLYQNVELEVAFSVIEAKSSKILCYKEHSYTKDEVTLVNKNSIITPSINNLLKECVDNICKSIIYDITPTAEKKVISFKKDKNPTEEFKLALSLASDGYIENAIELFKSEYYKNNNINALYNYAILLSSRGEYEESLNALSSCRSLDKDIIRLKATLEEIRRKDRLAKQQIDGIKTEERDYLLDIYKVLNGV